MNFGEFNGSLNRYDGYDRYNKYEDDDYDDYDRYNEYDEHDGYNEYDEHDGYNEYDSYNGYDSYETNYMNYDNINFNIPYSNIVNHNDIINTNSSVDSYNTNEEDVEYNNTNENITKLIEIIILDVITSLQGILATIGIPQDNPDYDNAITYFVKEALYNGKYLFESKLNNEYDKLTIAFKLNNNEMKQKSIANIGNIYNDIFLTQIKLEKKKISSKI
jgi:hypothetical protein